MKKKLTIVKVGGKVIDDSNLLEAFIDDFSRLPGSKILVHGGGTLASDVLLTLGIQPKMVEGRRVTDSKTLDVVVMVYAGLINKTITAKLNAANVAALGLSGADLMMIHAEKRPVQEIDYGFAGDVTAVDSKRLDSLLSLGYTPVFCAVTSDSKGQLLNTNADTIASALAVGLSKEYKVDLIYAFEWEGVMKNTTTREVYRFITPEVYTQGKAEGRLTGGIIPKIDNAFEALNKGVEKVVICSSESMALWGSSDFTGTVIKK